MKTLNVLFLWHMHQPSYAVDDDPFWLPWTRLHGTKDYIGMAHVAARASTHRMTFNFTPVLWEQLLAYASGTPDKELELCRKPTATLTLNERQYLLSKLFTGNPVSLIDPFPRYAELLDLYGRAGEDAAHRITERDLRDLSVWRMLAWVYPDIRDTDPVLNELIQRQSDFTEEDKERVVTRTLAIVSTIPDAYRDLDRKGQIDIVTTPYYHPILPLLIDSDVAKESAPSTTVPPRFQFPEDADWHISEAIRMHTDIFGEPPEGMWPAEGSISAAAAGVFAAAGIRWIATDELILARSLGIDFHRDAAGRINRPDVLYRPWRFRTEAGEIAVFFRDHQLSDLIGFDYQSVPVDHAVTDFIQRLKHIHSQVQPFDFEPCVCVILDGENAWEHYSGGGFPFLERLFHAITSQQGLHLETMSAFLHSLPVPPPELPRLHPGSWIHGDFGIWMGQSEENAAWNCIRDLHDAIGETMAYHDEGYSVSRRYLRQAEASDTFWWLGDDHFTTEKAEFDALFRKVLIRGYETAGLVPPGVLYRPLIGSVDSASRVEYPKNLISPVIDGDLQSYFDWFGAGTIDLEMRYSAMHGSSDVQYFSRCRFGFDLEHLFFRFDPLGSSCDRPFRMDIVFRSPDGAMDVSMEHVLRGEIGEACRFSYSDGRKADDCLGVCERVCEIRIPFGTVGIEPDERVVVYLELWMEDRMVMRVPDHGEIVFFAPTEDYDSLMWRV
ncbi:hypothetical protein JXA80_13760 [bacterium]|nr:hypothetical protein [candidate division CSSED10-310 bacterium]